MHAGALKALEFDRIVEVVRGFALTSLGSNRLAELHPSTDPRRVETSLAATTEAVAFLAEAPLALFAPSDLDLTLAALTIEGRALEPLQLRGFADFMASVEATATAIRRATPGAYPLLSAVAERSATFAREVADVHHKIDPAGEVTDDASTTLRSIRERLRKQRGRLRNMLESYLRGKETAKYLQDQIVTDRHGRYVLVVKAEHRSAIPGIVHGTSTSGASLYLEPLSSVEVNNDIVALEEQEREEVRRILLALSDSFRARALDLKRTLDTATEVDVVQARAHVSKLVDGVAPALATDGRLELRNARHPLLMRSVAEKVSGTSSDGQRASNAPDPITPVPVDILLIPPSTTLVVTGPNTGGKTVALKTAGLLTLMAQAGLHVPAEAGSQIPVFRSVFADIGDEQSITANLSTFSWHITNIASMERALTLPALVLLDEIGAGTDPVEGGALGIALIEHFRTRGALVIATTHYDTIKTHASTADGIVCAAVGFDPEAFAPTYRLVYGSPGRSLALEIATRLGLPRSIVDTARRLRTEREAQLADHLAKVERQLEALERERQLLTSERQALADRQQGLHPREEALWEREESLRRRLNEPLDDHLREARRQIDDIIGELRERTSALAADAARRAVAQQPGISTGETGAARADAQAAVDAAIERLGRMPFGADPRESQPVASWAADTHTRASAGDRVVVQSLGLEGVVRQIHDHDIEVDVRGKRLRVPTGDLRLVAGTAAAGPSRVSVSVQLQPRTDASADLNVIGCSVDDAITRAEKFLDEALIAELNTVRIIHGYGTGQLRRALAGFLHGHPLVERFGPASPDQGGGGVTEVALKE